MIAEVEIRNTVESIKVGSNYPPYTTDPEVPMLTGWLSDEGQLLHLDINREKQGNYVRIIYLYYGIVDTDYRKVDYNLIEVSDPLFADVEASSYEFDISSILTIPRRTNRVMDINEIVIDLFTYEANITDCTGTAIYGKKRLSVPYKVEMDASVMFPVSTDGWYPIGVIDYSYKDMDITNDTIHQRGDLVYWHTSAPEPINVPGVYKCLSTGKEKPNAENRWWVLATNEDIMKFYTIPPGAASSATTIVGANAIISRFIKKEYIAGVLPRISYKGNDDKRALYSLMKLTALRESSILKLEQGDVVAAAYLLDVIRNEHDAFWIPNEDIILTQINSTYTV